MQFVQPQTPKLPDAQDDNRPYAVMIVDDDVEVRRVLIDMLHGERLTVVEAGTLAEAKAIIDHQALDLCLLDVNLPDGNGLDLTSYLREKQSEAQSIVLTGQPSWQQAVEAIRQGAADLLAKPINVNELNERVAQAFGRRNDDEQRSQRWTRMRSLCKKLNHARHEITQQVDILCNDLVTAYQELVTQMQHVESMAEFRVTVEQELDLEQLLRRTLEYTLRKVGPTNAVMFLPASDGGFSVGGYVNFNCSPDSANVLLQHLADVAAPKIAEETQPMLLTNNDALQRWIGDDAHWLSDTHVFAMNCIDQEEPLASLMLFRDADDPFSAEALEAVAAVSNFIGSCLARVVRIHHRHEQLFDEGHNPDNEDDGTDGLYFPFDGYDPDKPDNNDDGMGV